MRRLLPTAVVVGLLAPSAAFAGGGGMPSTLEDSLPLIGLHVFNLLVLVGILYFATRKRIKSALDARADGIRHDIEEATKSEQDARAKVEELEARMSAFESRLDQMRADAEAAAANEREQLLARAEADAKAIEVGAERAIRDETERARAELRQEAARLAVDLAAQQVSSRIADEDHARLNQEFLAAVKGRAGEVPHG